MNLWVKRTGQLLLAALFLMSCEDDSFLLGFKNQNKKFNVKYQEFSIGEGSVIAIDSVITDNNSTSARLLIGEDIDTEIGTMRAEAFADFSNGAKLSPKTDHTYHYDSLVLFLHLDNYSYGLSGNAQGKYKIYRLIDKLSYSKDETYTIPGTGKEVLVKEPQRYYTTSTAQYFGDYLGETRFEKVFTFDKQEKRTVTTINLSKLKSATDTLVAASRISDEFGAELFESFKDNLNEEFTTLEKFKNRFRGFAIIPEETNAILGFSVSSGFTRLRMYYHSKNNGEVIDTLTKDFSFSTGSSFHSITSNRNESLPPSSQPYVGTTPGSFRVVQAGDAMVTKIDLNSFYDEFADVINDDDIIINAAEIVIESVNSSEEYKPLSHFRLRVMEEDDGYLDYRMISPADRDSLRNFYVYSDTKNYFVLNDFQPGNSPVPVFAPLTYNSSKNSYSGSVTLLIQSLFSKRNSNYRIQYLGLYPEASGMGKSLDRSIFLKENIKLRVYYTQANKSNL
jgi:hypothetical protein